MIDYLSVRIPAKSDWSREFAPLGRELQRGWGHQYAQTDPHYSARVDLRQFEHDAILHLGNRNTGDHKLTVFDTGQKSFREIVHECERVWAVNPRDLEVMRVDLCADIEGTDVSWFRDHARVKYKRKSARFLKDVSADDEEFLEIGRARPETWYSGKRPNCIRVYDKYQEWRQEYRRVRRAASLARRSLSDMRLDNAFQETTRAVREAMDEGRDVATVFIEDTPPFEQWVLEKYGRHVGTADVLTRVERMIAGGRVPDVLGSVKGIESNVAEFNPFDRLEFLNTGRSSVPCPACGDVPEIPELPPEFYQDATGEWRQRSAGDYLELFGWQCLVAKLGGADYAVRTLTPLARGHMKKLLEKLGATSSPARRELTTAELVERYRASVEAQLVQ